MGSISANFQTRNAFGAHWADDDVDCPQIQASSYELTVGIQRCQWQTLLLNGAIGHLSIGIGLFWIGITDYRNRHNKFRHATQMRFGDDLLQQTQAV